MILTTYCRLYSDFACIGAFHFRTAKLGASIADARMLSTRFFACRMMCLAVYTAHYVSLRNSGPQHRAATRYADPWSTFRLVAHKSPLRKQILPPDTRYETRFTGATLNNTSSIARVIPVVYFIICLDEPAMP